MEASPSKLQELTASLEELQRRQKENRLQYYEPYPKQLAFHALGATKRERLFLSGNQLGKTFSGGMEMAMHLTGRYPEWWTGKRFTGPIRAWAIGVTSETTRDTLQKILLGPLGAQGSGAIPKDAIIEVRNARGIADFADVVLVRHYLGGTSQVAFKSFEKGREKLQGETLDCVWLDEEPPEEIYSEALARIAARSGIIYLTCTPLMGQTTIIRRFLSEGSLDRGHVTMTIDDAGHISAEDKARIIQGYRPHEVEARVRGIPMMGSGKVFPIAESVIAEEGGFPIPKFWPRIVGLDLGWDHATAACWLAWDRDADIVHVTDCYKVREQTALLHAEAIKARGSWIPVAWPHDAAATEKGGGETMAMQYRKLGLRMLDVHAQHPDGGISVEASIQDLLVRMQTSRLKIAAHLGDLWEELRLYHRKDGRLVKEFDDLISALRYGVMMLRHARTQPDYSQSRIRQAIGTGADPLGLYGPPTTHNAAPSSGGPVWGNGRPAHLEYNYRSRPRYARGIDDDVLS